MHIIQFIKNWTLPIAIVTGIVSYFVYVNIPWLDSTHAVMSDIISIIQPGLIFVMLLISLCKVNPRDLRPHRWQMKMLAIQVFSFLGLALPLIIWPDMPGQAIIESGMACMICPTATAASVVTSKLHGNTSYVVSYTCLTGLAAAIFIPLTVPLLHADGSLGFAHSFSLIIGKVFPLLMLPLILALAIRYTLPSLHAWLIRISYITFYLWAVALALAIGVTTKAIVHSHEHWFTYIAIAMISIVCCLLQFWLGRRIGARHGDRIAGAQSLGQKNTAFAIWMSYTFMNPVSALAGGFYSIWHNIINSYQLWQERKKGVNTINLQQSAGH